MSHPEKGSTDEAIGRPKDWREGRYEQGGKPVESTVVRKPGEDVATHDPASTPVTPKDYEGGTKQ